MVPYDQSEQADKAVVAATDLAKRYGARVSLVACIVPQVPMDPSFAASYAETLVLLRKNAEGALDKMGSKLRGEKIAVETVILEGVSITDEIVSFADSHGVDLIVMGSRGLGGFKKLLLGSVASGVSQHSKCPVMIVK